MVDGRFENSLNGKQTHQAIGSESTKVGRFRVTIDMLPDIPLLAVFYFYIAQTPRTWYRLVHVCRCWRSLVFGSPCRLNLRLYCTNRTPVMEMLQIWPVFPIVITVDNYFEVWRAVNITMALEHNDRIRELSLQPISGFRMEKIFALAAMRQPFPALTHLELQAGQYSWPDIAPIVPASFLGGSAPLLKTIRLNLMPFPGLPKLLLSSTHLVDLRLQKIPRSGYISPEAMVTSLTLLTSLETLHIDFESRDSSRIPPLEKGRRHPSPTRTLLPVLTELLFKGVDEYLEELVAPIDAPLLNNLHITFFDQPIFDTPQLMQFISRTPNFKTFDKACLCLAFSRRGASIILPQSFGGELELGISTVLLCRFPLSLAQLCRSSCCQTLIPAMKHLYIVQSKLSQPRWHGEVQSRQWLELLLPFAAVKDLYISSEYAPHITSALQELARERVTEVLPALQTLFLEDVSPLRPVIKFAIARLVANHPVHVFLWEREMPSCMRLTNNHSQCYVVFVFAVVYYLLRFVKFVWN